MFPCPLAKKFGCGKTFTASNDDKKHSEIHGSRERIPCPLAKEFACEETFTRVSGANQHTKIHENHERIPCLLAREFGCEETFATQKSANEHEKTQHRQVGKIFGCLYCANGFSTLATLQRHQDIVHEGKVYKCRHQECSERFRTVNEEAKHAYNDSHRAALGWICKVPGSPAALSGKVFRRYNRHQRQHVRNGDIKDPAVSATWTAPYSIPKSKLSLFWLILDKGGFNQTSESPERFNEVALDLIDKNEAGCNCNADSDAEGEGGRCK